MTDPAIDRPARVPAPATWQAVDFMSDLHLQVNDPDTQAAWLRYLQARPGCDALFILGDLFEVWVGDDVLAHADTPERAFVRACAEALQAFSRRTPVFFIAGNRDFLLGDRALAACGMQGLADPCVLRFAERNWLLSHGDAWCLADTDYMAFRAEVRQARWQTDFLARPLAEREAIAADLRARSEARKHATGHDPSLWADVDDETARSALRAAQAQVLIHGHTHRPATHELGDGLQRVVLSDWDLRAQPPRAEVLRLQRDGLTRLSIA